MPHLGHLHDDSIYWAAAKSLAQGHGYRILSLPQQPFETKYPPLFALALSLIWKLDPRFPENLQLSTVFAWVWLPIFLALAWRWFSRAGFEIRGRIALRSAGIKPLGSLSEYYFDERADVFVVAAGCAVLDRAGRWR